MRDANGGCQYHDVLVELDPKKVRAFEERVECRKNRKLLISCRAHPAFHPGQAADSRFRSGMFSKQPCETRPYTARERLGALDEIDQSARVEKCDHFQRFRSA